MAEVIASLERLKVSSSPSAPCAKLLDTSKGVAEALDSLKNSEEVFVDLEGLDLCRHGTITLLSVLSNDAGGPVYVFDVKALGAEIFTIGARSDASFTLKTLLESPATLKILYDLRMDCDALFHLFQVKLHHALDLQLVHAAFRRTRGHSDRFVVGLARVTSDLLQKERLRIDFTLTDVRPVPALVLQYCEKDMYDMRTIYARLLQPGKVSASYMRKAKEQSTVRLTFRDKPDSEVQKGKALRFDCSIPF